MHAWAIKWRHENKLDGKREVLLGRFSCVNPPAPDILAGYVIMAFKTRASARDYIKENYGHITRPDLRAEPFGWKMPIPVKVSVEINELKH